jgi:citrate synthase
MIEGRLPTADEAARFVDEVAPLRVLPGDLRDVLPAVAAAGERWQPLMGLRTALSLLASARSVPPLWDADPVTRRANALLVCAVTPTILAALHRLRAGRQPLEPRPDLSAAANWLYLVTGKSLSPSGFGPWSTTWSRRSTTASPHPPSPPA